MLLYTPRDLGAAIREKRKATGLDQTALAAKVGVSRRWLINVENGAPGASIGLLLRTLNALGLTLTVSAEGATSSATPSSAVDLDAVLARTRKPR